MEDQIFSTRLKAERELHNWTRVEFAQQIGSSPKTIARWERGETLPRPQFHQKLCMIFNKTPQELGLGTTDTGRVKQFTCNLQGNSSQGVRYNGPSEKCVEAYVIVAPLRMGGVCTFLYSRYVRLNSISVVSMPFLPHILTFLERADAKAERIHAEAKRIICVLSKQLPSKSLVKYIEKTCNLELILKYYSQRFNLRQRNNNKKNDNIIKKHNNIFDKYLCILKIMQLSLYGYYKYITKLLHFINAFYYSKTKVLTLAIECNRDHMYQIACYLANIYQYATASCIFVASIPNFSKIHPQIHVGRLVHSMQNLIQTILQVLSHPAWQGIGTILSLISVIISLLSFRSSPANPSQKKIVKNNLLVSVPPFLLFDIIITSSNVCSTSHTLHKNFLMLCKKLVLNHQKLSAVECSACLR